MNYYNEFDPKAAAWLRELIKSKLIPEGIVDERSITAIRPGDLAGFAQCHFFAGIGGWSHALRLAGWSADRPVWTGSCPCQPFSSAGKHAGVNDSRHLWPVFAKLIAECRPPCVFGEQVESAIGHGWLDGVHADMAREGYAVWAEVLGAHSVGAPHRRQRLYWVADASGSRREGDRPEQVRRERIREGQNECASGSSANSTMANATDARRNDTREHRSGSSPRSTRPVECRGIDSMANAPQRGFGIDGGTPGSTRHAEQCGEVDALGNAIVPGCTPRNGQSIGGETRPEQSADTGGISDPMENPARIGRGGRDTGVPGGCERAYETAGHGDLCGVALGGAECQGQQGRERPADMELQGGPGTQRPVGQAGAWSEYTTVHCRDNKTRRIPVEPAFFPLAHGVPARVVRLRGYGNAIVPQVAAAFIGAYLEGND